jgi:hypothetical protein
MYFFILTKFIIVGIITYCNFTIKPGKEISMQIAITIIGNVGCVVFLFVSIMALLRIFGFYHEDERKKQGGQQFADYVSQLMTKTSFNRFKEMLLNVRNFSYGFELTTILIVLSGACFIFQWIGGYDYFTSVFGLILFIFSFFFMYPGIFIHPVDYLSDDDFLTILNLEISKGEGTFDNFTKAFFHDCLVQRFAIFFLLINNIVLGSFLLLRLNLFG